MRIWDLELAVASFQPQPRLATASQWQQLRAGRRSSPSSSPPRWWPGGSPDSLVSQPAGVTLVEAVLIGGLQLLGCGDDGAVLQAGSLRPVEVQGVARGDGSVVEHNACKTGTGQRAGQARPPITEVLAEFEQ